MPTYRHKLLSSLLVFLLAALPAGAQIVIGGNVYGGGNEGDVSGNTTVTIRGGDIHYVYGGARMANVGGRAAVLLDGKHSAEDYTVINYVFGGNDISGTIGTASELSPELELRYATENNVDESWNAFVRVTSKRVDADVPYTQAECDAYNTAHGLSSGDDGFLTTSDIKKAAGSVADDNEKIYVGQLFGGGNGDYDYESDSSPYKGLSKPELDKTYLEITGGSMVYVFGGGNKATVTENVTICVDNPSDVVHSIIDTNNPNAAQAGNAAGEKVGELLTAERTTTKMALNTVTTYANSNEFQIGSFFGGNNKVAMDIHPKWDLKAGKIRNLYSGGNEGDMTYQTGLLLVIPQTSTIIVDNLYGGCRKADVRPFYKGTTTDVAPVDIHIDGYNFPDGLPARIIVEGGDINNVYGGNDISGDVYGGSAVGIRTSIRGNVYGGGNGSYAYTDNPALKDDVTWGDFYYDTNKILGKTTEDNTTGFTSLESAQALNIFRPHAEYVSLRVWGRSADNPTIIGGDVFIGGNSASLRNDRTSAEAYGEFKIGSHVWADRAFIGNNGQQMIDATILERYHGNVTPTGGGADQDFSQMDLLNSQTMAEYMDGCAMSVKPHIVFDDVDRGDPDTYQSYTTYIGSFFCGGNVGSMTWPGTTTMDFDRDLIIFDKLVGGCNNANVDAGPYNAQFLGGILGSEAEQAEGGMLDADGNIKDALIINIGGVTGGIKIQPKRWKDPNDKKKGLVWNAYQGDTPDDAPTTTGTSTADDKTRRLKGGNIYGGCYNSGHVNGGVVINLNDDVIERNKVFDVVEGASAILYQNETYNITQRNSGVLLSEQGMDPLGLALNVFGGGYGKDTEIWGNATINLTRGYTFQIFGGGEHGSIGKVTRDANGQPVTDTDGNYTYAYDKNYSTYIRMAGSVAGSETVIDPEMAETEFIYGGGFEGAIAGNTHIYLDNGRLFNTFAGSCNADIEGHTETYVGLNGFPYVVDHIYGGNDLGGTIKGESNAAARADCDFSSRVSTDIASNIYSPDTTTIASAYIEYKQGHILNIFGGCYGVYDYAGKYSAYADHTPRLGNAFVNFKPAASSYSANGVVNVFGAGEGQSMVVDRDVMQERSYILVDIPQSLTTFQTTNFFGAGAFSGLGMDKTLIAQGETYPLTYTAVIDLMRGQINNVYGGSYEEGITRRTQVNVPEVSTIQLGSIFGGAYGVRNELPCDVYESHVDYSSADALVAKNIYGGNNNARRTLYANVNINSPVYSNATHTSQATVFGAGLGENTWAQYTNVHLNDGAIVYEAYGGGNAGHVLNKESAAYLATKNSYDISLGDGYTDEGLESSLAEYSTLAEDLASGITHDGLYKKGSEKGKFNTNLHVHKEAHVSGYAYGAGQGKTSNVNGTTCAELLGGTIASDLYAGGWGGSVLNNYYDAADPTSPNFIATANVYVKGGTVRNVYGGGYSGNVGWHDPTTTSISGDVLGMSNVVIGAKPESGADFYNGIPSVLRNAYGGGEGASVYGTTHITVNNGYVGYRYDTGSATYNEELDDNGTANAIEGAGNVFGGGYVVNSLVDSTYVYMYGGTVRGSLFGGGEVGTVGRGQKRADDGSEMTMPTIHKGGATHIYLYEGHVMKDVFGGGRGYDSWGGDASMYMSRFLTPEELAKVDFFIKGFVFGFTDVNIRGGEIGTAENVGSDGNGYGNVFGGGDVGYVYASTGRKLGSDPTVLSPTDGLPVDGGGYYYIDGDKSKGMSHNTSVDVAPYCKVIDDGGITIGDSTFLKGEYVPVEYLDQLKNRVADAAQWAKLDDSGITIHNAVFAGGNVSVGSDAIFVNTNTVYGNSSASLRDIFHRDLISVGEEHIGGLYGDGNLTFVDGFRELNITNYGTDWYNHTSEITLAEYDGLTDREKAYFKLEYECQQACSDKEGLEYAAGDKLVSSEYHEKFSGTAYDNESYWKMIGYCSAYDGRVLNTIQRADFVGVWGSRLVLAGARDRVPEKADYTNYTINRVNEVSLNQVTSKVPGDEDNIHGNYFGIYNVVHYLGNLTSDVRFSEVRTTTSTLPSNAADGTTSYLTWKNYHVKQSNRNNGTSQNKVALASGVYLELKNESGEKTGTDDWGYVTGIIELDLINVMQGLGGGYVYAKNEHGQPTWHRDWKYVTLLPHNASARTYRRFTYADVAATDTIETSGNFIHPTKTIVDDCYPTHNLYYPAASASPAHYWYIKGQIYVYDQYISAYTGSANAYSESVSIPLTISAQAHGKLHLREIKPNLYAYYDQSGTRRLGDAGAEATFTTNGIKYSLNDPITWWEWNQLSASDQQKFVPETYTTIAECYLKGTTYPKGYTLLPSDYEDLVAANPADTIYNKERYEQWKLTEVFRPSNNVSHDTGYALTYDIDNPMIWNNWYTKNNDISQASRINTEEYAALARADRLNYTEGPTYYLNKDTAGVFGQKEYEVGDIINNRVYDTYTAIDPTYTSKLADQAVFQEAYVVTEEINIVDNNGSEHHLYPGVAIVESDYPAAQWSAVSSKIALANVVTSTMQLSETEYLYAGDLVTAADTTRLKGTYPDAVFSQYVAKAYYCTQDGKYGGTLYEPGRAYRTLDALCSMSAEDRKAFTFNYDALDVLIDPTYHDPYSAKHSYDGTNDPMIYSVKKPADYLAAYLGTTTLTYTNENDSIITINPNDTLLREAYEDIPNEKYHYSPISVTAPGTYYVVKEHFIRGDIPYTIGETIDEDFYNTLNDAQKNYIDVLNFTEAHCNTPVGGEYAPKYYYYCRESYTVGENGEGAAVTTAGVKTSTVATYNNGEEVPHGIIISPEVYATLPNKTVMDGHLVFNIFGDIPVETSTLYVSRESDIYDLSKEKIITVVYLYEYEESDEAGLHITPQSERHIVNIHLQFKSGVPEIGQLNKPGIVLPGSTVGLKVPYITPGAYEILSSGWELFTNESDATRHTNGQSYQNNNTPMYWYQDGYWVAYYAKTYLGKTYSNAVQFSVANYHDMKTVMDDKAHHYYVDHADVHRDPKIYINDYTSSGQNGLQLFKDFYDLSLLTTSSAGVNTDGEVTTDGNLQGHKVLNTNQVGGAKNLEFILRADQSVPDGTSWTPIGEYDAGTPESNHCFDGTLHGDGYTISGLDHSLFKNLCGDVYNLGVTGSFDGAGIVENGTGYMENCWVSTTGTPAADTKPLFNNPLRDATMEGGRYADKLIQIVNCYYPTENGYSFTPDATHGLATEKPMKAFYNGEVTYDLNGFYLYKRYADNAPLTSGTEYSYFKKKADGTYEAKQSYYEPAYAFYPLSAATAEDRVYGYVEDRYADGDFIYAGGSIPETKNIRFYEDTSKEAYYPIWPDDYIFFGQRLTYGYYETDRPHQPTPSHINKSGGLLATASTSINRVFRAPAYFRSKQIGVAHYNPYAVFSQSKKDDAATLAYKYMTAIDFTGGNGDLAAGYQKGLITAAPYGAITDGAFYPPLIDNDGLEALRNVDLTQNWLVYAPEATSDATSAASKTNTVVLNYLIDPTYRETDATYHTVARQDVNGVHGHAVVGTDGSFTAPLDHFLVDKQDFNAPMAYTFGSGQRMWHQRTPEIYVDTSKGWEGISIPFSAEIVTTQQKGEITYFNGGSPTVDGRTKVGHELWLRQLASGGRVSTEDSNIYVANFSYPDAGIADKEYTNTFLWDYYYKNSGVKRQDKNTDIYQQDYYSSTHTLENYGYSVPARPYIIGFPGTTYYEFDLSGTFIPANTKEDVYKLQKQIITFASPTGADIAVSDDEMQSAATEVTENGYTLTFLPNYLNSDVAAGSFMLAADGGSYAKTDAATAIVPFRPYFTVASGGGGAKEFKGLKAIAFTRAGAALGDEEQTEPEDDLGGELVVRGHKQRVYVTSGLAQATTIRIVNTTGALISTYTIQPGQTVETPVQPGIYLVNKTKIAVK